jgi:hypothetical protein
MKITLLSHFKSNQGQALVETIFISSVTIILVGILILFLHHECLRFFTENAIHEALICEQTLNQFSCKRKLDSFCRKMALNLSVIVAHPSKLEFSVTYYSLAKYKKIYLQVHERSI